MHYVGSAGNDQFTGTNHDDDFDLTLGGNDTALGKSGFDVFFLGDAFTRRDFIDGGAGDADMIILVGDYSAGLSLGAQTIKNIETLSLGTGFDYVFTFNDNVVAAGSRMLIDGGSLAVGDFLVVHAEDETNANYTVLGGAEGDLLATGAGNDIVSGGDSADSLQPGTGNDTVYGGGGGDFIQFIGTGAFDAGDSVDGGDGIDVMSVNGDYSAGLAFTPTMLVNVERLVLYPGNNYNFDLGALSAPAGFFQVDGSVLTPGDVLTVNAQALAAYDHLFLSGGAGNDVLSGGQFTDTFYGGSGVDTMNGRGGADEFGFDHVTDSTGPAYDTIVGFNTHQDFIRMVLTGVVDTPVNVGRLGAANFDDDLAAAVGAAQLGVHDAVLFTPSKGTHKGELFLIIDQNGAAGYQAGEDLVIHLQAPKAIADFSAANFGMA